VGGDNERRKSNKMTYKVLIKIGSGKNFAQMGSIPLKDLDDVSRWIKKNPLGNWKTKVKVEDISNNKSYHGIKATNWRRIIK
jgi:hypothetical protein